MYVRKFKIAGDSFPVTSFCVIYVLAVLRFPWLELIQCTLVPGAAMPMDSIFLYSIDILKYLSNRNFY